MAAFACVSVTIYESVDSTARISAQHLCRSRYTVLSVTGAALLLSLLVLAFGAELASTLIITLQGLVTIVASLHSAYVLDSHLTHYRCGIECEELPGSHERQAEVATAMGRLRRLVRGAVPYMTAFSVTIVNSAAGLDGYPRQNVYTPAGCS